MTPYRDRLEAGDYDEEAKRRKAEREARKAERQSERDRPLRGVKTAPARRGGKKG